jgi:hypothetical protein
VADAVRARTLRAEGGLVVPGARRTSDDTLLLDGGGSLLALSPPRRRTWKGVRLVEDEAVSASATPDGWSFRGEAEVDVLQLSRDVVADESVQAFTVLGAFTELAGASTLGRFLVAGQVLDTTLFAGARCPSEQTALGVYRVARHRGGPFWDGVAALVADWTEERVRAGHLVHDLLGEEETHTRFVADAVLLLAAEGRHDALSQALLQLDALGTGVGGDRWWRHDSLEQGGSDLVLNTHLLALLARRAGGLVDDDGVAALHRALAVRPSRRRALVHAADLLAGDLARGALDGRRHGWVGDRAHTAEMRAARARQRSPHLVLPGGRTARDVRAVPSPAYHTVNTADLASYAMVTGDPVVRRRALAAARYARASGHWRALLRERDPVTLLVPGALLRLGQLTAAQRWAGRLVEAGWAPALGWPGHVDQPWARLPAGAL